MGGVGKAIKKALGGGGGSKTKYVEPAKAPTLVAGMEAGEGASKQTEAERKRIAQGQSDTILTGYLGDTIDPRTGRRKTLG